MLDAAKTRRSMHGKHAADHAHTAEAERIRRAVSERNGLLSAKQAAALILDEAREVRPSERARDTLIGILRQWAERHDALQTPERPVAASNAE